MSFRNSVLTLGALVALGTAPALADCSSNCSKTVAKAEANIVSAAEQAGQFKTLLAALKEAGLAGALQGEGPFTVFAPTDAAFAKLPAGALEGLLKNPEQLKAVLTYHVVPGRLKASDVLGGAELVTLQGEKLEATTDGKTARIDGAAVIQADLECSNGVIHVVDTVLLP
jgi:uncharacterized surface protein with fasciclin (FAS1) repeats